MHKYTLGTGFSYYPGFSQGDRVVHGFSQRGGGFSNLPFVSLNTAFHVGDDPALVVQNRERLFAALGLNLANSVWADQVHGEEIAIVDSQEAGAGAYDPGTAITGTDALVTAVPGISLSIMTADCFPILLFDPVERVIAAVHAGWRGTVNRLAAETVGVMRSRFGTQPKNCRAALGPGIGSCCFQVGAEVAGVFHTSLPQHYNQVVSKSEGIIRIDLYQANYLLLQGIGVSGKNIFGSCTCTACNTYRYYSYRKEKGMTGRLAAVIGLLE